MQHKGTPRLETPRLILRRFVPEDAEAAFRHWTSDDEVTRYLTWPTHQTPEVTEGFIRWVTDGYAAPDSYQWAIELKSNHALVGNISAVGCNEAIDAIELGWVLGRAWWGQGIMPEAAGAVLRFFFEEVGANRVWAGHDIENGKSGRVMEKIGMRREGTLRAAGRNNRGIVDMAVYGVTRADWLSK